MDAKRIVMSRSPKDAPGRRREVDPISKPAPTANDCGPGGRSDSHEACSGLRITLGGLGMTQAWFNHVSISANDLDESTLFYTEFFGAETIPTPNFGVP